MQLKLRAIAKQSWCISSTRTALTIRNPLMKNQNTFCFEFKTIWVVSKILRIYTRIGGFPREYSKISKRVYLKKQFQQYHVKQTGEVASLSSIF